MLGISIIECWWEALDDSVVAMVGRSANTDVVARDPVPAFGIYQSSGVNGQSPEVDSGRNRRLTGGGRAARRWAIVLDCAGKGLWQGSFRRRNRYPVRK
ncbi:hypothetical protein [Nocardia vaccinii]|uniref:hypothetical protein n=1 Tax=Nocardia vaccinii TaxID=1822 RepID=UPI000AF3C0AD|nr:hypothetical protein [Nocardia vaccinii]